MVTIILKRSVKELKHDDFKNREVLLFLNKGKETIKQRALIVDGKLLFDGKYHYANKLNIQSMWTVWKNSEIKKFGFSASQSLSFMKKIADKELKNWAYFMKQKEMNSRILNAK